MIFFYRLYNKWLGFLVVLFWVLSLTCFLLFFLHPASAQSNQNFASAQNAPVFTLTQNDTTVYITTTTGLSDFQYFEATSDPDCSPSKTTGWSTDADGSVAGLDDDDWICFKAKNSSNTYGYAELEVDLTKPDINVVQDWDSVDAQANVILKANDEFGWSVAISGDYMAVGSRYHDGHGGENTGAVYMYKRSGTNWKLYQEIYDKASGFTALSRGDAFGQNVDLDGDYLAVGAPGDNGHSGGDTGAVYIFKLIGNNWQLQQKIADQAAGFYSFRGGRYFRS